MDWAKMVVFGEWLDLVITDDAVSWLNLLFLY